MLVGGVDTPGNAYSVDIIGSYAYVADAFSGLQLVDVSDPGAPTLIGGADTPHFAYDVAVEGAYAYVADAATGLQIVDIQCLTTTSVAEDLVPPAQIAAFLPPAPNPSPGATALRFGLARSWTARLEVYDLAGRHVRRLFEGTLSAGHHLLHWDGNDDRGRSLPGGAYLVRLTWPEGAATSRLTLLR